MITFETLRTLGKPIAYYPKLAKPLGGANPVILFSHLLYWHDKTENDLGVYKTVAEIEDETGLTESEQKTACEKLERLGILSKTYKRLTHRMYYKLNPEVFNALMIDFFGQNGAVGEVAEAQLANPQERSSRTDKSAVGEVAEAQLANPQERSSRTDKSAVGEVAEAQLDEPTKTRLDKGTINYQENTNNKLHTEINASDDAPVSVPEKKSQKSEKRKSTKQADIDFLITNGFDPELAAEWVTVRHAKGAKTLTSIALKRFLNEVEKSGLALNQVLEMCIVKCWISFEAEWIFNRMGLGNAVKQGFVPTVRSVETIEQGHGGVFDGQGNRVVLKDYEEPDF